VNAPAGRKWRAAAKVSVEVDARRTGDAA